MGSLDRLFARRLSLNTFLASIGVNAVLGIWALLAGDFGETQGKILSTSFLISVAMLSVLVNTAPLRRKIWWPLPLVATGAAVLGILWFVGIMWTEPSSSFFPKLGVSAMIVGGGGTLLGLLGLVSLRRSQVVLRALAAALIGALVVVSIVALWAEISDDWMLRLIGVLSILTAASAVALPVLARFVPVDADGDREAHALRFCPSCGDSLTTQLLDGRVAVDCPSCGLHAFLVREHAAPTSRSTTQA